MRRSPRGLWSSGATVVLCLSGLATAAFIAPPARAGIEASPVVIEATVPPDTVLTGAWRIRNPDSLPTQVTTSLIAFDDYNRGRRDAPPPKWIRIAPETFTLRGGAETNVTYRLELPPGSQGETVALVFFVEKSRGRGTPVVGRLGTVVYALASGTARPALAVRSVRLQQDSASGQLLITLANYGNVHVRPHGSIAVLGPDNAPLHDLQIRAGAPIFPGREEVFFSMPLSGPLPEGRYRIRYDFEAGLIDGRRVPPLRGDSVLVVKR